MKRVYYETLRNGLVAVKVISRNKQSLSLRDSFTVKVVKDHWPYYKGHEMRVSGNRLVHKAGRRGYHLMVKQVDLSKY